RRLERARKDKEPHAIGGRRPEAIVAGRWRREERVRIRHHLRHPLAEGRRRLDLRLVAVLRNPLEAPLERPDDAIRAEREEVAFPGVKEPVYHFLLCGGAPPPPPVPSRPTPLGIGSSDCPLSDRFSMLYC